MEPIRTAFPKLMSWGMPEETAYGFLAVAVVAGIVAVVTRLNGRKDSVKYLSRFYLVEYLAYILCSTLILRHPSAERIIDFDLIGKYHSAFVLLDPEMLLEIIMNILMFVPLGFLMVCRGLKDSKVLVYCFALSLFIEVVQYVVPLGRCELSDMVHNTLGAMLGFGVYRLSSKLTENRINKLTF